MQHFQSQIQKCIDMLLESTSLEETTLGVHIDPLKLGKGLLFSEEQRLGEIV